MKVKVSDGETSPPPLRLISRITPAIHHSAPKANRAWDSQSPLAEKKGDTPPAEVGGGDSSWLTHTTPGPRQTNDRWIDCLKALSRQLTDRQHIQYVGQLDNWHFLQTRVHRVQGCSWLVAYIRRKDGPTVRKVSERNIDRRVGTTFETPPSGYYMSVRKGLNQLLWLSWTYIWNLNGAQESIPPGRESVPGFLQRSINTGSGLRRADKPPSAETPPPPPQQTEIAFLIFKKPRNRFHGIGLSGRYDNPIPTRFLASIDSSKIPALD